MKRGTENLLKFKHLMRDLDLPEYAALGLLQSLWMKVDINCPRGDIGRFSNEDIALLLDWRGDPDVLVNALVHRRWMDEHPEHRLIVHDWPEHCEDTTHRKLARAREYFADGSRPKTNRVGKEQAEIDAFYDQDQRESGGVQPVCAQRAHADEKNSTPCAPTVTVTVTDTSSVTPPTNGRTTAQAQKRADGVSFEDLRAATGDPPEFKPYWVEVGRLLRECGEYPVLPKALAHMRASPGIKKPGAWLNRQCSEALAKHGKSMPKPPSRAAPEEKSA